MFRGYLYIIITVLIWGIEPIIFKSLSGEVPVSVQSFLKVFGAFIFLSIYNFFKKENNSKIELKKFILPSILLYGFIILFLTGLKLTKANIVGFMLGGVSPIMTIIVIGIFILSERKQLNNLYVRASLLCSLIGIFIITVNFESGSVLNFDTGSMLVFVATVIWGFYSMIFMKNFQGFAPELFLRNITFLTSIYFLVTIVVSNEIYQLVSINPRYLIIILITSFLVDVIAGIALFKSFSLISATKANIITFFTPIITIVFSWLILNESLTFRQVIGCLIVFIANFIILIKDFYFSSKDESLKVA